MSESRGEAKRRKDNKKKEKKKEEGICGDAATHRNDRTQSDTNFSNNKNTDNGEGEGE